MDMTPHTLTREQVAIEVFKMLQCLYIAVDKAIADDVNDKVMKLVDLYRHDLAQQAQEVERLKEKWQGRRSNLIDYYEEQLTLVKAELTASEQELMKVRAEKDEQWVKLCAAERKAVRLRETLEEIIRQCPYGATPAERNIAKLAQRALKGA